jgi:indole-3-glycerol phosphate synthase
MSADVLMEIVAVTRDSVAARRAHLPIDQLAASAQARGDYRPFREALARPGLSVIAEHKRSSPSAGVIRADLDLSDVVAAYERGGAAALSVLTEGTRFGGTLADLFAARTASSLPILRKDFIVDEYQVYEAAASGADAILLIVAAMEVGPLANLHALAGRLGLATLVEVHNAPELQVAVEIGAQTIGVNNRNLSTLVVDIETTYQLLPQIPAGVVKVAESGFRTPAELERLAAAGVDAVLIGEALMRSSDIEAACRDLAGVGARISS